MYKRSVCPNSLAFLSALYSNLVLAQLMPFATYTFTLCQSGYPWTSPRSSATQSAPQAPLEVLQRRPSVEYAGGQVMGIIRLCQDHHGDQSSAGPELNSLIFEEIWGKVEEGGKETPKVRWLVEPQMYSTYGSPGSPARAPQGNH